jgi:hypothetical protein
MRILRPELSLAAALCALLAGCTPSRPGHSAPAALILSCQNRDCGVYSRFGEARMSVSIRLLSILAALLSAIAPLAAQTPDCAGIDDVSEFDGAARSDFDGFLTTVRVASGLSSPTYAISPPDGPAGPDDRLFIVEQPGAIRILDLASGQLVAGAFLDITALVLDNGNEHRLPSRLQHAGCRQRGNVLRLLHQPRR